MDKDGRPHARIRDGTQTKLFPLTADGNRFLRTTAMWCAMARGADGKRKPVRLRSDKDAATVLLAKLLEEIEEQKAGIRRPASAGTKSPVLTELLAVYGQDSADRGPSLATPPRPCGAARKRSSDVGSSPSAI